MPVDAEVCVCASTCRDALLRYANQNLVNKRLFPPRRLPRYERQGNAFLLFCVYIYK